MSNRVVLEDDVVDRLRAAIGQLSRSLRATQPAGVLSPSQREVLGTVARRGPMRVSELADAEGMNLTMLSRILSHLQRSGLVDRIIDEHDGRVVHVAATRVGRRLCDELRVARTAALERAVRQLSERDVRRLREAVPVLENLVEAVRTAKR